MNNPELILYNGKIFSVTLDDRIIRGEAIAVKDGVIYKIGKNEEIKALAGENTEMVDCKGNSILPGFADAHCHPSLGAISANSADLFGIYVDEEHDAASVIETIKSRVKEFAEANRDKDIIRGAGWVYQNFNPAEVFPTRHDLDEVCPDKPVVLESFCQHNVWVNTKALELAGIDENAPEPSTGKIFREEDGYPQGVFNDVEALTFLKTSLPGYDPSVEEIKNGLNWYMQNLAARNGITLICDCLQTENATTAYKEMAEAGELTLRARGTYHLTPDEPQKIDEYIARKGNDNIGEDFRIDTVKMFSEGQFALTDGYRPEFCEENNLPADFNGELYWSDDVFVASAAKAMEAGFNVHVHAMGDASVVQSAKCLARAQELTGKKPRNIIAHLMLTPDEAAELMGREEIIANCQPEWMMFESDVSKCCEMTGMEKGMKSYPLRKFLDNGVMIATGTDFPVSPVDTMPQICVAMTRKALPFVPGYEHFHETQLGDEKPAELAEIIKAMTIGGAYQNFAEEFTGSIEEGKSAELVILDGDIEETPADDIYKLNVVRTIFKGKTVFNIEG